MAQPRLYLLECCLLLNGFNSFVFMEYSAVFADSLEAFGDGLEVAPHSLYWMELESSCMNPRYQE